MIVSLLMAAALGQAVNGAPAQGQGMNRGPGMNRGAHMDRGARMDRFFQMADTDHNGQLSKAELEAARARMREHRMERRQNGGAAGGDGRQWRRGMGGWNTGTKPAQ